MGISRMNHGVAMFGGGSSEETPNNVRSLGVGSFVNLRERDVEGRDGMGFEIPWGRGLTGRARGGANNTRHNCVVVGKRGVCEFFEAGEVVEKNETKN